MFPRLYTLVSGFIFSGLSLLLIIINLTRGNTSWIFSSGILLILLAGLILFLISYFIKNISKISNIIFIVGNIFLLISIFKIINPILRGDVNGAIIDGQIWYYIGVLILLSGIFIKK